MPKRWLALCIASGLALAPACSSSGGGTGAPDPGAGTGGAGGAGGAGGGPLAGRGGASGAAGMTGGGGNGGSAPEGPRVVELNFLFVHGVQGDEGGQSRAERSLEDLETSLMGEFAGRAEAFELGHPLVKLSAKSARANIYTGAPSPNHPSDSPGPITMDDWEIGAPGCATARQGDPCTTAYEWRYRLAREIERLFPNDASNLVLVGHSTGARAAFEVAANAGPDGVDTYDWGVRSRIAGVVSIHGMIDALNDARYNALGPTSFVTLCKAAGIAEFFGTGTPGQGWCEYAGFASGNAAADWVGQNKSALGLIAQSSDCSPALWTGDSDQSLPFDAQASRYLPGLAMTRAPGETFRAAHGVDYGRFCHSDLTNGGSPRHGAAVDAARARLLDWLFVDAPRVLQQGTITTLGPVAPNASTPAEAVGAACPPGFAAARVEATGVCKHPGGDDGDDHPIDPTELELVDGPGCQSTVRWTQRHDGQGSHSAIITWKTLGLRPGGLVEALTAL